MKYSEVSQRKEKLQVEFFPRAWPQVTTGPHLFVYTDSFSFPFTASSIPVPFTLSHQDSPFFVHSYPPVSPVREYGPALPHHASAPSPFRGEERYVDLTLTFRRILSLLLLLPVRTLLSSCVPGGVICGSLWAYIVVCSLCFFLRRSRPESSRSLSYVTSAPACSDIFPHSVETISQYYIRSRL